MPAIVDREVWEAAQQRMDSGKQESPRNAKYKHLMSRRLRCSCGYAINQKRQFSRVHDDVAWFNYRCSSSDSLRLVNGKCGAPAFKAEEADHATWSWIVQLPKEPETMLHGYQDYQRNQRQRHADLYDRIAILDDRISQEQAKADNLLDLFLDNKLPKDMLDQRRHTLDQTLDALRIERATLERQVATVVISDEHIQTLREYGTMVAEEPELNSSYEFRRRLVEDLAITGTLVVENEEKILHLHWLTHQERVQLATDLDSIETTPRGAPGGAPSYAHTDLSRARRQVGSRPVHRD